MQEKDKAKEAEEKFKEIAEAYEVLSDKDKRKAYDEEIKALKSTYTLSKHHPQPHSEESQENNAVNRAFDSYLHNLREKKYEEAYKKDTKHYFKNVVAFLITAILVLTAIFLILNFPQVLITIDNLFSL